ncbi:Uncharacterised protein [uncultured archaeon]|nr:Uncharacterised protein [uncultured archaeon]
MLELSSGNYYCPKKGLFVDVSEDNINCPSIYRINCSYGTSPLTNVDDPFCEVFESARAKYLALTPPKCTQEKSKSQDSWKGWKEKPC